MLRSFHAFDPSIIIAVSYTHLDVYKRQIIGSGAVGATTAYSLVVQGVAAEVVLVDLNQEKAGGEALDMQHSMEFQRRNVRVGAGGYEECADADIVVITAAAPMNGEVDRRAALGKSAAIMKSIVPEIMKSGFDGIFLVVSNPVDAMAWLVWKLSGLPASRVIGTGTILETARLKHLIAKSMSMDPRSVDAVSYTHLDVYKRQGYERSHRDGALNTLKVLAGYTL